MRDDCRLSEKWQVDIMRLVNIDELIGNEILALPVISGSDEVLIQSDTTLKKEYIDKLKKYDIEYVYIKDNVDYDECSRLYSTEETYEESVDVVKKILSKHIYKINDDLKKVTEQAEKIINSVLEETEVMDGLTEIRNISTDMYSHCTNVCALSTIMAIRLKMNNSQIKCVATGAILHDIGLKYIQVPYVNVELDEMSLNDRLEYKKHTIYGYSSIQEEEWLSDIAKDIILLHHERIDGNGFPFRQKGERIGPEVKLVALCDDFDSLISGIGNKKIKIYEAIEYIKAHIGTVYDANIASKFLETVAAYPVGLEVITNEGEIGKVIRQNKEAPYRPVLKMLKHSDGSDYEEGIEKDLMKALTVFIVDTL